VSRKRQSRALTADSRTLQRLAASLFPETAQRERFVTSLVTPPELSVGVAWIHDRVQPNPFETVARTDWMPAWTDLVPFHQRPGRHPLHESGVIYCLDPSSIFSAMVLCGAAVEQVHTIIDVCASPGGKSILASRLLTPAKIVCNEVIGKRTAPLIANLRRCRIADATVVSSDVSRLVADYAEAADVVIVDAPCSGQSLIARGKESPGCFHPATINMNANRQRRILATSLQLVRPGGFLAYMTCTYSPKENERNVHWLLKQRTDLHACGVPALQSHQSPFSETPCYRIWPYDGVGAGGFCALLRRDG
jgi:16S rRNA C967 or C1407 C5-methylase (RsmB/RsmF family)